MNADPRTLSPLSRALDAAMTAPFPASRKVYVRSNGAAGLAVPMREISLEATPASFGAEENTPLRVYDCSGPYTDPAAVIDLARGLSRPRAEWVAARGDVEQRAISSTFARERQNDPDTANIRFPGTRTALRARPGARVTQMH